MLTLEKCREILDEPDMDDAEIEELQIMLRLFINRLIDEELERQKS